MPKNTTRYRRHMSYLAAGTCLLISATSLAATRTPGLIAAGATHSLRVDASGYVWAVGDNASGQLGNGTFTGSVIWQKLSALNMIQSVATGSTNSSLALGNSGQLYGWGGNNFSQLCTTAGSVVSPRAIMSNVIDYHSGQAYTAMLKADGTVWFCGRMAGTTTYSTPHQVTELTNIIDIHGGTNSALALRGDGTVWAWGTNSYGLNGTPTVESAVPLQVIDSSDPSGFLQNIVSLAKVSETGAHALKADGTVWYWSDTSATKQTFYPANVTQLRQIGQTRLALTSSGAVWSEGKNDWGQLGRGFSGCSGDNCAPAAISSLPSDIIELDPGLNHMFAVGTNGAIYAWGRNDFGQLGLGFVSSAPTPFPSKLAISAPVVRPAATGTYHSLAVNPTSNRLRASGHNGNGRLGIGSAAGYVFSAADVVNLPGATLAVAGGYEHSLGVQTGGGVFAWGSNLSGQLGVSYGTGAATPQPVALSNVVTVSAGRAHSLALTAAGEVYAWGNNSYGQLGDGTKTKRTSPTKVPGLSNIVAISAGYDYSLALSASGNVFGWGRNYYGSYAGYSGALGDNSAVDRPSPTKMILPAGTFAKAIDAGAATSFVVTTGGRPMASGSNRSGEFGNGTYGASASSLIPVYGALNNVVALSASNNTVHAIAGPILWGWGENAAGELGRSPTGTGAIVASPLNLTLPSYTTGFTFVNEGHSECSHSF